VAVIQALTTTPLILYAEIFEVEEVAQVARVILAATGDAQAQPHPGGVAESFEIGRFLFTALSTIGIAVGFAWVVLSAIYVRGGEITARTAVPWAVAAFLAAGLAPSFGLAPELPGAGYIDLASRQIWWFGTTVATALAFAAFAFGRKPRWIVIGIVLIVLPHVIGAPEAVELASAVPAEVAAHFSSASLVVQALTWILPATIAGYAISRMGRRAEARAA
jgi:cobalt transporter subunit CbtA